LCCAFASVEVTPKCTVPTPNLLTASHLSSYRW
jgi:hypothetical protein